MKFKYVIINNLAPVIFLEALSHKDFKSVGKITSAGYVNFNISDCAGIKVSTYGESIGLDIKPRPEDAGLIQLFLQKNLEVESDR